MSERDIFIAALERADPAARAAYLDEACGGDAGLRARLEALLRAHVRPDSLLDAPAAARAGGAGDGPTRAFAPGGADGSNEAADDLGFLAPPDRPGSLGRLGHYEVQEVLGRGGFGIVLRAVDDTLGRVVAVKALAPAMAATSPARKRFVREARGCAAVRHENVVQVYAVVEDASPPYLVMEFIPGETLQQRVHRTGPLDPAEAAGLARQVALGLAAAHARGLVHRDVKPANVLVEADSGRVKLTDFGLARAADDASLTQSGAVAGTPMYMSPEQARGEAVDHRSDLFSLGGVLYLMLTGRPPFRAEGMMAVLRRVVEDAPRPVREVIPEVPEWLCRVVERLHAKDPADRYQTALEAADALAAGDRSPLPATTQVRRGRNRVQRLRTTVLALVLATVAGAAFLLARPGAGDRRDRPPGPAPAAAPEGADAAFARRVADLPPRGQVDAVVDELKRRERARNPGRDFGWKVGSRAEGGRVVMLDLSEVEDVADVAPVAALRHLRELHLPTGATDIGPLNELKLQELTSYGTVRFADLSALRDMPLDRLMLWQWPGTDMTVLRGKRLTFLNVGGGNGKVDLTALRDMPLRELYVMGTDVTDLAPIASLRPENLGVGRTQVKSLEPLRGMRLTRFSCDHTPVADLGPLEGMPLEELYVEGAPVASLAPVAKAPLRIVRLDFNPERGDAAVLRGIATLETINDVPAAEFWKSVGLPGGARPDPAGGDGFARVVAGLLPKGQVRAVEAELRRLNLDLAGQVFHKAANGRVIDLNLGDLKNLKDVTPVAALRHLQELRLPPGVPDVGPLGGLALRKLVCPGGTGFTDLTPLKGMPLEHLLLWGWKGTDLSPLAGRPRQTLRVLNVGGGHGTIDLIPLKGMPLEVLYVPRTDVADLSPLAGMKLRELGVNHTRVADLEPLRGMPLELLDVRSTPATDLGPVRDAPLKHLLLDFRPEKHAGTLRGLTTLERVNETPVAEFWKQAGN